MNAQQMELIESKYGKLIHHIGHSISGDGAISGHDDNTQDLWIAVMDAIRGYEKKEGKSFEEFYDTKGFDKYIKTCLWNMKNSKGSRITKRSQLTKGTVCIQEHEEIINNMECDPICLDYSAFYDDLPLSLSESELDVVKMLVESPNYVCENGRVNVRALSKGMGRGWETTRKILDRIGEKMRNNL